MAAEGLRQRYASERRIARVPIPCVDIRNSGRALRPTGIAVFVNAVLQRAGQMLIARNVNHKTASQFAQRGGASRLRPRVGIEVFVEFTHGGRTRTDLQVAENRLAQTGFHLLPAPVF